MISTIELCNANHFEWIDLEAPTDEEIKSLEAKYGLHPIYLQDVLQAEHLPKWEYAEEQDTYFLIARYFDDASKQMETIQQLTRKVAIFVMPERIITIHRGHTGFLDALKAKCETQNHKLKSPFALLCRIIKEVFKTYDLILAKLSEELDFYEGKVYYNKVLPPFTKGIFFLKRRSSVLKKVVILSKVLLEALREMQPETLNVVPLAQDTTDMFIRVETLADDLSDRTNNLISIHLALSDQRNNEVMRVLTVFSAFFLPITFIAGVYGMNFEFMPELSQPYGYFATLGVMFAVVLVIYSWFRRKGWF